MKKTKKEFKPSYIVNLDEIEHLDDIALVFALAKHNAGLPLTDQDLWDIIDHVAYNVRPHICICNCICTMKKKLPWYKRFWRWLTRKKD